MAEDKEWSEDPADDPIELQKEHLKLGKEFLARIKKQEAEEAARRAQLEDPGQPIAAPAYTPPSFEEVSAVLKKAWDGVEAIMPTAPGEVKAMAFQTLMHAAAPPPTFGR
jgi:hypothetical protein